MNTSNLLPVSDYEPLPGQQQEPPPPIEIDGEEEYTIEQILNARIYRRRLQFLVKWRGYENPDDNTWEPEERMLETAALDDFEARNTPLLQRLRTKLQSFA